MQKLTFVIGANAAGKTYFIEHHLANGKRLLFLMFMIISKRFMMNMVTRSGLHLKNSFVVLKKRMRSIFMTL